MATARTNQLPSVSFTVTAGTAKSLKIASDSYGGPEGYCELVLILSSSELIVGSSELIVGS